MSTPTRLYGPNAPGTSNGTLYTVPSTPAPNAVVVTSILIGNTSGSAATISLAVNGTAATAANCFMKGVSIEANTSYLWEADDLLVLAPGDTIQGLQGTSGAISIIINGRVGP